MIKISLIINLNIFYNTNCQKSKQTFYTCVDNFLCTLTMNNTTLNRIKNQTNKRKNLIIKAITFIADHNIINFYEE